MLTYIIIGFGIALIVLTLYLTIDFIKEDESLSQEEIIVILQDKGAIVHSRIKSGEYSVYYKDKLYILKGINLYLHEGKEHKLVNLNKI